MNKYTVKNKTSWTYYGISEDDNTIEIMTNNLKCGTECIKECVKKYNIWVEDIMVHSNKAPYKITVYYSKKVEPLWKIENEELEQINEEIPVPIIIYKDLFPILYYPERNNNGGWVWKR